MLLIGIIVVLIIVPGFPMPVKESKDTAIFEDDIIIKEQPKTTPPPSVMNIFEDHVMLRRKANPENLPSSEVKSALFGDETNWWKNHKTTKQPIVQNNIENVFEDHFIMKRNPNRKSTVVEDNIMMRKKNIFEDNIAMKQDLNVFEDNIIMRGKGEEIVSTSASTDIRADGSISVYEDNIMLRKRDVSQNLESSSNGKSFIIEDDIAMHGDGQNSTPANVAASEYVFEDHVMMKNKPNSQLSEGSSDKSSNVYEDHVFLREDGKTTTIEPLQNAAAASENVFEDHFIMKNQPDGSSDKSSNVFEDHVIMREDADTTTRSVDTINPKVAVFEDNIMMRSDSQDVTKSPNQMDSVIEDNIIMREDVESQKAKNSFVTEDHVILRTENGANDTNQNVGPSSAQALIIIEDHLLRKRRESNSDLNNSILEDNVMHLSDTTQASKDNVDKHVNQKTSIIIEDHLIR